MAYLKNEFETWIKSAKRNNGSSYSTETINNYISVIKNYCKKLDKLSVDNVDLFFIDNATYFEKIHSEILKHPDFDKVNQAYHRAFSSGLLIYKRFLQSRELTNGRIVSFEEWLTNYKEHKYRDSTIKRYIVALQKAEERLSIVLEKPILEIKSLSEFESAVSKIQAASNYDYVNKKYGNGDLSAALSAYAKYLKDICSVDNSWWPSLEEYDPGISKEKWIELLNDSAIFTESALNMIAEFYTFGGTATCAQLAEHYGRTYNYYLMTSVHLAERIVKSTGCPVIEEERNAQNAKWWPVLYVGKDASKEEKGSFIWKIREELFEALTEFGIEKYLPKEKEEGEKEMTIKDQITAIKTYIAAKGFNYDGALIENFYLGLKSKPFVILAGTSGTGKTRLVRLFAEAIGAEYKLVSVRPDWSDSSDLFGHVDLNQKFVEGSVIKFVKQAELNPSKPYFLCLDEMNLARVEYYMSDILSAIETRRYESGMIVTDPIDVNYGNDTSAAGRYGKLILPGNLYIVGTVNMDETTFPFSKKVLDRANTIEFSYVDLLSLPSFSTETAPKVTVENDFLALKYITLNDCDAADKGYISGICTTLSRVNGILEMANAHIGYRVRDEIVFYMLNNKKADLLDEKAAFDNQIMQKILPRIQGSSESIKKMLEELLKICDSEKFEASAKKINFMIKRYDEDGFTSYWL